MEVKISVVLCHSHSVLKHWEQTHRENMTDLLDAVKHVKKSVNDFLSDWIMKENKSSGGNVESTGDSIENDNFGDTEANEDSVSGLIRDISHSKQGSVLNLNKNEKRRIGDSQNVKKIKK